MKEIDLVDENVENSDFLDMKDFSTSTSKRSKTDVQIQIEISTFKKSIAIRFKFFLTKIISISTNKIIFSKTESFSRRFYSTIKSFFLFAFIHDFLELDYNSFVCSCRSFNSDLSFFDQFSVRFFEEKSILILNQFLDELKEILTTRIDFLTYSMIQYVDMKRQLTDLFERIRNLKNIVTMIIQSFQIARVQATSKHEI